MLNSECKRYRLRFNKRSSNSIETSYIPFDKITDIFSIVVKLLLNQKDYTIESVSVEVYRSELDKWVNIDKALWS